MNSKEFEDAVNNLGKVAKSKNIVFVFAAMTPEGDASYVFMDASGEDVAFFAAEIIFDYCKRINEAEGLVTGDLIDLSLQEVTNYLEVMKEHDKRIQPLSDDLKGDMN